MFLCLLFACGVEVSVTSDSPSPFVSLRGFKVHPVYRDTVLSAFRATRRMTLKFRSLNGIACALLRVELKPFVYCMAHSQAETSAGSAKGDLKSLICVCKRWRAWAYMSIHVHVCVHHG